MALSTVDFHRRLRQLLGAARLDVPLARALLAQMTTAHIGSIVHPAAPGRRFSLPELLPRFSHITAIDIFETSTASCVVFVIPPQKFLHLHDHPSQHVLCRVLHGDLGHFSFDWQDSERCAMALRRDPGYLLQQQQQQQQQEQQEEEEQQEQQEQSAAAAAILVGNGSVDAAVAEGRSSSHVHCVTPTCGGVLHQFHARSPSQPAVFCDIISPPYNTPPHYIECTYWKLVGGPLAAAGARGSAGGVFSSLFGRARNNLLGHEAALSDLEVGATVHLAPAHVEITMDGGFSSELRSHELG